MTGDSRLVVRYVIPLQVFVLVVYAWYLTAGLWTHLPDTFHTHL